MLLNLRKEQFSIAYVRAVAAAAGYAVTREEVDVDSVDLTLAAKDAHSLSRRPKLDVQMKCTAADGLSESHLHFALPRKNYDELRNPDVLVPHVLVVVLVPENLDEWLEHTEQHMILRRCGYWLSLRGAAETTNTETVTVQLPRKQTFDTRSLQSIMERINRKEMP